MGGSKEDLLRVLYYKTAVKETRADEFLDTPYQSALLTGSVSWPIENHTLHRISFEIQVMMEHLGPGKVSYVVSFG